MCAIRFVSELTSGKMKTQDTCCPCELTVSCKDRLAAGVHLMCELPDVRDVIRAAAALKSDKKTTDWLSAFGDNLTAIGFQDGVGGKKERKKLQKDYGYSMAYAIGVQMAKKNKADPL